MLRLPASPRLAVLLLACGPTPPGDDHGATATTNPATTSATTTSGSTGTTSGGATSSLPTTGQPDPTTASSSPGSDPLTSEPATTTTATASTSTSGTTTDQTTGFDCTRPQLECEDPFSRPPTGCQCDLDRPAGPEGCEHTQDFQCEVWFPESLQCTCDPEAPLGPEDCREFESFSCAQDNPPVGCTCVVILI